MQLKEQAHQRDLMVRELKYDVDTGIYVASESEEGTCGQVD